MVQPLLLATRNVSTRIDQLNQTRRGQPKLHTRLKARFHWLWRNSWRTSKCCFATSRIIKCIFSPHYVLYLGQSSRKLINSRYTTDWHILWSLATRNLSRQCTPSSQYCCLDVCKLGSWGPAPYPTLKSTERDHLTFASQQQRDVRLLWNVG